VSVEEKGAGDGSPQPFPWAEVMAFGLGVLRLPPEVFWAMTPAELKAAAEGVYGKSAGKPMERAALETLLAAFPDEH
jgi:uncharacterized phage protein (TIGR02216 family)